MPQDRTVHTKDLGNNRYRDLIVCYEKGCMNYWNNTVLAKGIYLVTFSYGPKGTVTTWSTRRGGDSYLCVVELPKYRPSVLKAIRDRVEAEADAIHDVFEGSGATVEQLEQYLRGEIPTLARLDREAA